MFRGQDDQTISLCGDDDDESNFQMEDKIGPDVLEDLTNEHVSVPTISILSPEKKRQTVITPTLELLAAENSNMKEDIESKLNLIME